MRNYTLKFVICLSMLVVFAQAQNKMYLHEFDDTRLSKIDSFFNENISNQKLAGAVTLVSKDNKIQYLKSFGYLDVENSLQMNNEVIIPIASMTKIITSIAVLILYEDGKLMLNDPIEKYLPELKNLKVLVYPDSMLTEEPKYKPTIKDFCSILQGWFITAEIRLLINYIPKLDFKTGISL